MALKIYADRISQSARAVILFCKPIDPEAIKEAEKNLAKALSMIEDYWLKDGKFLVGRSQPSIVSELLELVLLNDKDHKRIFSPYTKVVKWVEDTKSVIAPYFDEVHEKLFTAKKEWPEHLAVVLRRAH
ncbi:glutathione S-transferase-like protein [Artemisia annua]|uniref:Glutathione S-transferase-like protein n=1 Tax=Artemisia annua TaxID=35608 RepID=A0A2U1NTF9_ARTAN|nr:glutathione S-transferase-like protein [Artemisia annua]